MPKFSSAIAKFLQNFFFKSEKNDKGIALRRRRRLARFNITLYVYIACVYYMRVVYNGKRSELWFYCCLRKQRGGGKEVNLNGALNGIVTALNTTHTYTLTHIYSYPHIDTICEQCNVNKNRQCFVKHIKLIILSVF